jgi:hypothetical protein
VRIRIEGRDLPGRTFGEHENVHVAVPRRNRPKELLDMQPGDAGSVSWSFDGEWKNGEIVGPYVQGGPGGRFIYLSWGAVDDAGTFEMFRRAKLMIDDIDERVLRAAKTSDTLVARLRLTDRCGGPLCARVRPPAIEWSTG